MVGLTPTGCVAARYWQKIEKLNERAVLDVFVVMPNHVHGLLGLVREEDTTTSDSSADLTVETGEASSDSSDASSPTNASNKADSSSGDEHMSRISPEAGSVSTIVRSYKSAVTKRVRGSIRTDFGWQRRFDDHNVRDSSDFRHIRRYIQNNPAEWNPDPNHPARQNP